MERARRSDDREKPQISNGFGGVGALWENRKNAYMLLYTLFSSTQVGLKLAKKKCMKVEMKEISKSDEKSL